MKPKAAVKMAVDIVLTGVLLFLMGYQFWGEAAHEWAGAGMFVLFILHHILNRGWYKTFFKGKYSPARIFQLIINLLLSLNMIGQMISGIMLSRHVSKFVSIQGHYNLIFREEEREMARLCAEDNIAMTPYSALAGGRLSKHPGETSKRLQEDSYARFKYDATAAQDQVIIDRAAELADRHGVSMTEVSLAWLLTKVTAPVAGATKLHHVEGAAKAVDLELTPEEILYLEEAYVPHKLVGVMAQNTPAAAKEEHVWSTGNQKIEHV